MILYYRNNKRYAAVFDDGSFIEVMKLKTCVRMTTGVNKPLTQDAINYDVQINAEQFIDFAKSVSKEIMERVSELLDRVDNEFK